MAPHRLKGTRLPFEHSRHRNPRPGYQIPMHFVVSRTLHPKQNTIVKPPLALHLFSTRTIILHKYFRYTVKRAKNDLGPRGFLSQHYCVPHSCTIYSLSGFLICEHFMDLGILGSMYNSRSWAKWELPREALNAYFYTNIDIYVGSFSLADKNLKKFKIKIGHIFDNISNKLYYGHC